MQLELLERLDITGQKNHRLLNIKLRQTFNSLYVFLMLVIIHGCVFRVVCVNKSELLVVPLYHEYVQITP